MDIQRSQSRFDPNTLQELELLRGKLWSLQDTFATQIAYLKEPKYPFTWPDLLNKFNMLTAKFASLAEEFYGYIETGSNATLPKLMLHPNIPTTTEHETNILSVLLRTKLIPDIEKLELETKAALGTLEPGQEADEQVIQEQLKRWTDSRKRHDRVATDAAGFVAGLVNEYRDQFLQRLEDEEEQEEQMKQAEWQQLGFPSEDIWRRWKLECMMNYYSNGKDQLPDSDWKKMATNLK